MSYNSNNSKINENCKLNVFHCCPIRLNALANKSTSIIVINSGISAAL